MNCPRCETALKESYYEGVEVDVCPRCGGEFVQGAMLPRIVKTRESTFSPELLTEIEAHEPITGVPSSEREHPLACPGCAGVLQSINYAGDTAVIVDRCGACDGVWLDGGELEKIQAILRQWEKDAPTQLAMISCRLENARREAAASSGGAFEGSRFSFVNAVINRLLDAA